MPVIEIERNIKQLVDLGGLGLVLFLMTFILNGLARILIVATERGGGRPA